MWAGKKLCFLSFALKKILCHGMFTWNNGTCKSLRCVNIKTQSQFSLVRGDCSCHHRASSSPVLSWALCAQSSGLTAPLSVSASVPETKSQRSCGTCPTSHRKGGLGIGSQVHFWTRWTWFQMCSCLLYSTLNFQLFKTLRRWKKPNSYLPNR